MSLLISQVNLCPRIWDEAHEHGEPVAWCDRCDVGMLADHPARLQGSGLWLYSATCPKCYYSTARQIPHRVNGQFVPHYPGGAR